MSVTVSYDVFDTVVTRAFAHPRDVFVHLGTRLGLADPLAFARARWDAELSARAAAEKVGRVIPNPPVALRPPSNAESPRRVSDTPPHSPTHPLFSPEVTLDEIYAELGRRLGWDEVTARAAQTLELEIESRHLHAVPSQRAALAAARTDAGKLIFLSDMYLPSTVLRAWLEREGLAVAGDVLLVSGDVRANKSSGTLYTAARAQTGGEFSTWQHTGDHPFADVESPRRLGIAATHFTAVHLTAREWAARGPRAEFAPSWRSLLAGAMRFARLSNPAAEQAVLHSRGLSVELESDRRVRDNPPYLGREAVLWETGATVAGPLFYGFVRWTLAEATRRGVKRLYFLARDGQIFWRIAEAIQRVEPTGIECRYLHASRLLFAGPAELDTPGALRLLAAPTGQFHSRRQTLLQLGLEEDILPLTLRTADLDANLPQVERDALADWLLAPDRRALLRTALERRTAQARGYLHDEGVRGGEPVALVDTGWFGTIQRSLEHILDAPLTGFYLGLMSAGNRPTRGVALGFTNQFAPLPLQREESHKVLIELLARSDHCPANGFVEREGRWTVEFGESGPVNLDDVRLLQAAILAFTQRALDVENETTVPETERAQAVIEIYRGLHDTPTKREAQVLGFIPHSDQYFEQRHASLCAEMSWSEMIGALLDHRKRPPHWWIAGQAVLGHGAVLGAFGGLKKIWWKLRGRAE